MDRVNQMREVQEMMVNYHVESGLRDYFMISRNDINCKNVFMVLRDKMLNGIKISKEGIVLNDHYNIEIVLKDIHCYSALFLDNRADCDERLLHIHKRGLEIFIKKNHDYGDAFATFGIVGILIRMNDKMERIMSIIKNGVIMVPESVEDTLLDLHNYATMCLMLYNEK
jgi:hypothetical protein